MNKKLNFKAVMMVTMFCLVTTFSITKLEKCKTDLYGLQFSAFASSGEGEAGSYDRKINVTGQQCEYDCRTKDGKDGKKTCYLSGHDCEGTGNLYCNPTITTYGCSGCKEE